MSSITGSRHNCEQGQPKPQLGGGAQPTTTTKPQGGGEGHHHRPHPTGGWGGIPWGGGGRGGVAALHHPCPNRNNVRVSRAYGYQSIHAETIITFVFQEHTVTRASMPKP